MWIRLQKSNFIKYIFKFNENLINTFVHNLIILQIDKIDLLSTTTSSLLAELFKKVHFTSSDLTSAQKWGKFIDLVEAYRLNFNEDKTKQNIWQLLEPLLINIKIMAYYTIITPLTNNLKSQLAYCTFGCLKKLATF